MSKQLLPTFQALSHFARCWRHLRRTSSRRTTEAALSALYLTQVLRFMQAVGWIPSFPVAHGSSVAAQLILASNQFYVTLWLGPIFWMVALTVGMLLTLAGMQQTVAAICTARAGRSSLLLAENGEDDPDFLTSVAAEDLLWDVRLRRVGMAIGMVFFATISWKMLWGAGFAGLTFVVFLLLCSYVDNRLRETGDKLAELIHKRRAAERDAFIQMTIAGRI